MQQLTYEEQAYIDDGARTEVRVCEKHGEYTSIECSLGFQFGDNDGHYVKMWTACPECVRQEDIKCGMIQTDEVKERQRRAKLRAMGIPEMYYDRDFINYKTETNEQYAALQGCVDLTEGKCQKVLMLGGPGVGKTHLAVAALKKMGGLYFREYTLFQKKRECEGYNSDMNVNGLIKYLVKQPLLVIDEVGRTNDTKGWSDFLGELIDERHVNYKPIILISNYITRAQCEYRNTGCENCQHKNCIESRLDHNLLSRIRQNSRMITVTGRDMRQK